MTTKELEHLLALAKLEEAKIDPKLKELELRMNQKKAEADALAKQMEFLSIPDFGQIKDDATRDMVLLLWKRCWELSILVEEEHDKLKDAWFPPNKASQTDFVNRLNLTISHLFGNLVELSHAQDWGEHNKKEALSLVESAKKRKHVAVEGFEELSGGCACRVGESQCGKRCPCKKAKIPCQWSCRCTEAYCHNPYGCTPKNPGIRPVSAGRVPEPLPRYSGKSVFL